MEAGNRSVHRRAWQRFSPAVGNAAQLMRDQKTYAEAAQAEQQLITLSPAERLPAGRAPLLYRPPAEHKGDRGVVDFPDYVPRGQSPAR